MTVRNGEVTLEFILQLLQGAFGVTGTTLSNPGILVAPFTRVGSHKTLTVDNTVKTLVPDVGTKKVIMQVTGANIRYTLDGTNPVAATTGFLLNDSTVPIILDMTSGVTIKVIRDASVSGTLQYQFIGY
jgi:hypothetical protein